MSEISIGSQDVLAVLPWIEELESMNRISCYLPEIQGAIKATESEQRKIQSMLDSWPDDRYNKAIATAREIVLSLYGE